MSKFPVSRASSHCSKEMPRGVRVIPTLLSWEPRIWLVVTQSL